MTQFLFAYHGGKPENDDQGSEIMAKWQAWMEAEAAAFVDKGAPVGMSKTVSSSGTVDNGGVNPVSGYSIIEAADIEAACKIAKGCPIHENGGSIEIAEIMKM
ncbi:MAG: hypothetical protein HRU28_15475 [Rhizobiales bacterium]|nr:hypothetical protein [Hyphomicrobiales bacterium]